MTMEVMLLDLADDLMKLFKVENETLNVHFVCLLAT